MYIYIICIYIYLRRPCVIYFVCSVDTTPPHVNRLHQPHNLSTTTITTPPCRLPVCDNQPINHPNHTTSQTTRPPPPRKKTQQQPGPKPDARLLPRPPARRRRRQRGACICVLRNARAFDRKCEPLDDVRDRVYPHTYTNPQPTHTHIITNEKQHPPNPLEARYAIYTPTYIHTYIHAHTPY